MIKVTLYSYLLLKSFIPECYMRKFRIELQGNHHLLGLHLHNSECENVDHLHKSYYSHPNCSSLTRRDNPIDIHHLSYIMTIKLQVKLTPWMHASTSRISPIQPESPGLPFMQTRFLCFSPRPQEVEQGDHGDHVCQLSQLC